MKANQLNCKTGNVSNPITGDRLAQMIEDASMAVKNLHSICDRLGHAKRFARREGNEDNFGRASRALTLLKLTLRQKQAVHAAFECDAEGYFDHTDQESYTAHLTEQWLEITSADVSTAENLLFEIS